MLGLIPGAMPRAGLDELIGKVRAIDMDEVRREVDAGEPDQPQAAKAGGA